MVALLNEKRLTLAEHLQEIRIRLIYFIIFLVIAFIISFLFQEEIMFLILKPHINAMKELGLSSELKAFYYPETFMAYFKLNLIGALILAGPFGLWQMWRFIGAGLYHKEKKSILTYLPISVLLLCLGVLFGYFYLIPITLKFLAGYGVSKYITPSFNLGDYLSFFLILTLALGLSFELPLVMLFFSAIGIIPVRFYISKLRLAIVLIFVFSAIITPTSDPLTMTILAVPLIGLYGLGILLAWLAKKPKSQPAAPSDRTDKLPAAAHPREGAKDKIL